MTRELISETKIASEKWQSFFNRGDAAGCASMYEEDATMIAKPFGAYKGRQQIQTFWQGIIDRGLSDVAYINPNIEQIDEDSAVLTSEWAMNNARGVITRELWVVQGDGSLLLREDHFEAQA